MINQGLTVRGAQMHGQRCIPMLLDRLASGEIETSHHLATHTLSLDQAPTAYDMFKEKSDGCVRAVIRPSPRVRMIISRVAHGAAERLAGGCRHRPCIPTGCCARGH
ncbi:hypothetical protein [Streptomyces massasporeus]|uniref:hypothetical protein n=1 Tax=Streptomyces massasporeus TaxID=67324 RepID=UPI0033C02FA1